MLTFNGEFQKTAHSIFDKNLKKRVITFDPLYSAEQFGLLESEFETALGADFGGFVWQDLPSKQTFVLSFTGEIVDDLEVPGSKLDIIDLTLNSWIAEQT